MSFVLSAVVDLVVSLAGLDLLGFFDLEPVVAGFDLLDFVDLERCSIG